MKILALISMTFLLITGCAFGRTNLVKSGQVTVEIFGGKNAPTCNADVDQKGGEVIISGWVESRPCGGCAHISLVSPDGKTVEDTMAYYKPKVSSFSTVHPYPRIVEHYAYYEKRIKVVPLKGSKIKLEFINGSRHVIYLTNQYRQGFIT